MYEIFVDSSETTIIVKQVPLTYTVVSTGAPGRDGEGVPDGGTTNQVLRKSSDTDFDTEWHTLVKSDIGLSNVDNTSDLDKPVSTAQQAALDLKQDLSQKGQADGYASLDGDGKVPVSQLPSSIFIYKGTWNASTNTPTLSDSTGVSGWLYRVSVAGTQNLGSGNITFDVGDFVIHNGTVWDD